MKTVLSIYMYMTVLSSFTFFFSQDETDKVGSELTRLLAPITILSIGNGQPAGQVKSQGSDSQMWSTRLNSVDQIEDQEAAKQSGLKVRSTVNNIQC